MKNAEKLIKSRNWRKRLIGARLASIESVLQIVKTEQYHDVCEVIVQRLKENKDLDIVKEICNELADAKSALIRKFVAENAEFKIVLQIAKSEGDYDVCETIVQRLEENKDLDIVKESYYELANANSNLIRKFVAENAQIEIVLQMAKSEVDYDVCETIVQRLEESKDLDIVKESYCKLVNASSCLIRKFVAENAKIEIVSQMAKYEENYYVCEVIVRRLKENKDFGIVKENYNELANASSDSIRKFVAENAQIEIVLQMAKSEVYFNMCETIVQRLEENKDLDIVKESYNELANAKNELMRKFVAENAQIEIVLQIAKSEVDYDVCEVIVRRLEENKDLDIVKESYNKLANANSRLILAFILKNATIDIIEKIIKGKRLYCTDIIYSIYRNPNYINATSKEKLALLKNILPKYLIEVVKYEKDEEVLFWIIKKIK